MKKYGIGLLVMMGLLASCGMKDNTPQATLKDGAYRSTDPKTGAVETLIIDDSSLTFTSSKGAVKKWTYTKLKRVDLDFTFNYQYDKNGNKLPKAILKNYSTQLKAYPLKGSAFYFLQLDGGTSDKNNELVVIRFADGVVNTVSINGPNYQQTNKFLETDKYLAGTKIGNIFLPMAAGNLVFYFNGAKAAAPLAVSLNALSRPTPTELVAKTWIKQ